MDFFKETHKRLKDLVQENTTFWKFSQSSAGTSWENVFIEYIPGQIVEAKDKTQGLSFVRAEDLALCYMYGDQITEFSFDINDPVFQSIADTKIYETGNVLGEIKAQYLYTKDNHTLADPNTIRKIITLSKERAVLSFLIGNVETPVNRLRRFGFIRSAEFLEYILDNYRHFNCSDIGIIKDDIDKIYDDYMELQPNHER